VFSVQDKRRVKYDPVVLTVSLFFPNTNDDDNDDKSFKEKLTTTFLALFVSTPGSCCHGQGKGK